MRPVQLGSSGRSNYRLLGRELKRVRAGTECAIVEEQCGFRQGRGWMDQVFVVRQVCEKHLANGKDLFWAFMDLEKAYDMILSIDMVCGRY